MKRVYLAVVVLVVAGIAVFAQAEDKQQDRSELSLSADACRNLTAYQPGMDGDADYKPGVDVSGKPVVEADLNADGGIPAPKTVEFDLTVDMAQYLGVGVTPTPEGNIRVAHISVDPQGHVLVDGQPMEGQSAQALRALCKEAKKPADSGQKPDFQK